MFFFGRSTDLADVLMGHSVQSLRAVNAGSTRGRQRGLPRACQ